MRRCREQRARGFTLLEVTVVVLVITLLTITVTPAIRGLDSARAAAASEEVARRLVLARSSSMASGKPTGLSVAPSSGQFLLLEIPTSGGMPSARTDVLGAVEEAFEIEALYGIELAGFTAPDGTTGDGVIWFGYDGTPQSRDANGTLVGPATGDTLIELGTPTAWSIIVRRGSGHISREIP
ncbi:MAG: prepilin-type N-terminal cleavage/methylation domain-containing protein [Planctomycetota bacterium]